MQIDISEIVSCANKEITKESDRAQFLCVKAWRISYYTEGAD